MTESTRLRALRDPGRTYVYTAHSRRAGGLSIGIDLNPNRACNWRCLYCEVEGLVRGAPPRVDLARLEAELDAVLRESAARGPIGDVAIAGSGEPTLSEDLAAALDAVDRARRRHGLADLPLVLITNGSRVHVAGVATALDRLAELGGEAWFKLDCGTEEGRLRMHDAKSPDERVRANLAACAGLVRTWLQTMVLAIDGEPPAESECDAWLALVGGVLAEGAVLRGVHLYGFARPSFQPEAPRLSAVAPEVLERCAALIRTLGLEVRVHP